MSLLKKIPRCNSPSHSLDVVAACSIAFQKQTHVVATPLRLFGWLDDLTKLKTSTVISNFATRVDFAQRSHVSCTCNCCKTGRKHVTTYIPTNRSAVVVLCSKKDIPDNPYSELMAMSSSNDIQKSA